MHSDILEKPVMASGLHAQKLNMDAMPRNASNMAAFTMLKSSHYFFEWKGEHIPIRLLRHPYGKSVVFM